MLARSGGGGRRAPAGGQPRRSAAAAGSCSFQAQDVGAQHSGPAERAAQ
jgi:hypothetical protein